MPDISQILSLLFLMIGPFKIIGPFAKMTHGADLKLTQQIAIRAIVFSILAVLLASFLGETMLTKFGIPLPILAFAGGLIFFLVALQNIIQQFSPLESKVEQPAPTLQVALNPLAFPTIVTPYGIAAVMVFMVMSPDLKTKLLIGGIVVGIMIINLIVMLLTRHIGKMLFLLLSILGAILGVIQVSLGLMIMYNQFKLLMNMN